MMEELVFSLNELRKSGQLCDVKIVSKNGEHSAHRVILASGSKVFRIMFQGDFKEVHSGVIDIEDVESEIMEEMLCYVYTCKVDINEDNAVELYRLSDRFQITTLLQLCSQFLIKQLHPCNCLGLQRLGQAYVDSEMENKAFAFLINHFAEFVETEEFKELTSGELINIIKQDELNVEKEENVYEAVLAWADKDAGKRDAKLTEIMEYIRFPTMDLDFLEINVVSNPRTSDGKWNKMIYDIYHRCCRYYKHNDKDALFLMPNTSPCYSRKFRIPSQFIYVYGGWSKGRSLDITECYNHKSDQWTTCQKLNDPVGGRCYFGLAQIKQLIFFAGGYDGQSYLSSVTTYEPALKKWSEIAPMHSRRCFACLVNLKDKLYAIAGFDGAKRLATVEEYCPVSNQWSLISPLSTSRSDSAAVTSGDKIYVIGGYSGNSLRSVEVFDSKSDSWTYIAPLNTRRSGAGAVALPDGRIFVIGGYDGISRKKTTEFYDKNAETWIDGPDMHDARSNFAVCTIGNYVYVIGGYTGLNTIGDVERYDIIKNQWKKLTRMNCNRSAMKAAVLTGLPNVKDYLWVGLNNNIEEYLNRIFCQSLETERQNIQ